MTIEQESSGREIFVKAGRVLAATNALLAEIERAASADALPPDARDMIVELGHTARALRAHELLYPVSGTCSAAIQGERWALRERCSKAMAKLTAYAVELVSVTTQVDVERAHQP